MMDLQQNHFRSTYENRNLFAHHLKKRFTSHQFRRMLSNIEEDNVLILDMDYTTRYKAWLLKRE